VFRELLSNFDFMASRRLRNRSLSVSRADSENMDVSDVTCFESDAEVTVRDNPVVEQAERNADIVVPSNDDVTISTDSDIEKGKSDVWLTVHRNSVWIRKTN